uniref:Uncharacterized protein n=1 Tax=Noccaea caerulescens TaxID=107243 RepID=A0A1J3FL81_NOCCA
MCFCCCDQHSLQKIKSQALSFEQRVVLKRLLFLCQGQVSIKAMNADPTIRFAANENAKRYMMMVSYFMIIANILTGFLPREYSNHFFCV